MRLFLAINLNAEIKDYLSEAIQRLKRNASGGSFTRRENLHLTLVFLGETREDKLNAVKRAMDRVEGSPFRLSFQGFGRFNRRGGDIHWAGVDRAEALLSVQKRLSEALAEEGFSLENREYAPHLTLGREVRVSGPSEDIYGSLAGERHEMSVSRISLMRSERIGGTLVYTEIYAKELF
jgi:2'-5' RNA ligase